MTAKTFEGLSFPPLGATTEEEVDAALEAGDDVETEEEGDNTPDPTEALRAEWAQERARMQGQIDTLIQTRVAPPPPKVDDEPLPDPVEKPKEFASAMERRAEKIADQRVAQVTTQVTQQQAVANLWRQFEEDHEDLAKRRTLAEFAATQVANELRAAGLNPGDLVARDPKAFTDKVAAKMRAELGDAAPTARPKPRTAGTSGGSRAPAAKPAEEKPKSFAETLAKARNEMGYI